MTAIIFLVVCGLCILSSCQSVRTPKMTEEQQQAVTQLLRDSAGHKLMTAEDCTNSLLVVFEKEEPGYEPYFTQGDFNMDGERDFAFATSTGGQYYLFFSLGHEKGFQKPKWFATLDWLPEAGMFNIHSKLMVGLYYSDDGFTYGWDPKNQSLDVIKTDDPE